MIEMGTKKGQTRKTARRAYTPRRPLYTVSSKFDIMTGKNIIFTPTKKDRNRKVPIWVPTRNFDRFILFANVKRK